MKGHVFRVIAAWLTGGTALVLFLVAFHVF